jgi:hypothetical protein
VEVLTRGTVLSTFPPSSMTMVESPFEPYSIVALKQKSIFSCLESCGGRLLREVEAIDSKLIYKKIMVKMKTLKMIMR